MLAGYLPFDDDPANPEGDNINLLYKYIVSTPLTFPEYVTPHARDLLRRILVPNPRKRADLFEVARHSWLSEFAHVVELITSTTTTHSEIQNTTVPAEMEDGSCHVTRSASVREPTTKPHKAAATQVGGLATKQGTVDAEVDVVSKTTDHHQKKRQTVQVEYVAPITSTKRGHPPVSASGSKPRSHGPIEVRRGTLNKPLPEDPPVSRRPHSSQSPKAAGPVLYPGADATSRGENVSMPADSGTSRPATGGSMASAHSTGLGARTASYGQPVPPALASANVTGRIQQPTSRISSSATQEPVSDMGRPTVSHANVPSKFEDISGFSSQDNVLSSRPPVTSAQRTGGHKRSSTLGSLFGRSGSLLGRGKKRTEQTEKSSRKYPPVSMANNNNMAASEEPGPRPSMESRTSRPSFNIGFVKKRSGSINGSQTSQEKNPRRFSLLKAMGISKDGPPQTPSQQKQDWPVQDPPMAESHTGYLGGARGHPERQHPSPPTSAPTHHARFTPSHYEQPLPSAVPQHVQTQAMLNTGSQPSVDQVRPAQQMFSGRYPGADSYDAGPGTSSRSNNRVTLQKNKHFNSYHDEHAGSSGPAKRVMDFFRRRGRARGGEDE